MNNPGRYNLADATRVVYTVEHGSFETADGVVHHLRRSPWGSDLLCIGMVPGAHLLFNAEAPVTCLACLAKTTGGSE